MLSSLRLASRRSLPCILPRYARPITTEHPLGSDLERPPSKQVQEAMHIFNTHEDAFTEPMSDISVTPQPTLDLNSMHHHVPPAESPILQFLTTMIMKHGEYAKAQRIVSKMLLHIYAMTRSPPMPIVEQAVLAASPSVKLKKQKQRGGKSGMKPMALNERQRTGLALKWIRDQVIGDKGRGAPGKKYEERLAREMVNILRGASPVLDRKKKMHEEAMANRGSLSKRG